jgi:hypothetical protein
MLIRVHLAGGAVESFTQDDPDKIRIMWQSVDPARLFTQHRLVIAGAYSKAVFVCSEINRIDFIQNDCACWEFPQGYSDVVELSESDFANARISISRIRWPGAISPLQPETYSSLSSSSGFVMGRRFSP